MSNCQDLKVNIDLIVKCIEELKLQRSELSLLIEKQLKEKNCLEAEIERITYKLGLLSKNLCQRIATKEEYDKTIKDAEEMYNHLTASSSALLQNVTKNSTQLQEAMDKKVGSDSIINVFEEVMKTSDMVIQSPTKLATDAHLSEIPNVSGHPRNVPEITTQNQLVVESTENTSDLDDDFDFALALRKENEALNEAKESDADT
ncbi:uncharacterized protein LOC108737956 [Agrilus planipennis]|uniref:Uncharacterized protein LOC108737956 n=1 Tax=Agrilus planipennis TaxID=224129 RepID=A0A1W4X1K3_AGRPL|nr:uncharacterized protein LOC108737956 [Agrilus planipennis]